MNNKSFTLIELLVVIVIIGILAGVIMISTSSSIDKANIVKLKVFEESIANDLAANMVSRWKLDEINGVTTPDAWGDSTGTIGDGVTSTTYPTLLSEQACVDGECMDFDGSSDYIELPTSALGNWNQLTFGVWVKAPQYTGSQWPSFIGSHTTSTSYNNSIGIYQNTGHLHIEVDTDTGNFATQGTLNIPWDTWFYAVMTYNGSTLTEYINGVKGRSISASGNLKNVVKLRIGNYGSTANYLDGSMDDVRIYNAALSSSQIKQNYIAGLNLMLANGTMSKSEYNERIGSLGSLI